MLRCQRNLMKKVQKPYNKIKKPNPQSFTNFLKSLGIKLIKGSPSFLSKPNPNK